MCLFTDSYTNTPATVSAHYEIMRIERRGLRPASTRTTIGKSMTLFVCIVLLLGVTSTSSLSSSLRRFGLRQTRRPVNMLSDVIVDVTPKPDSKTALLSSKFTNRDRGEVNTYILQLEKESPIVSNALTSDHIVGSWDVVYSGSLTDPGLLLYQIAKSLPFSQISFGDLSIDITREGNATSRCSAHIGEGTNVDIVVDSQLRASDGK